MTANRRALPVLILAAGLLGVTLVWVTRPRVEVEPPSSPLPIVRVQEVASEPYQFTVSGYGTVMPRTESDLVPQVSGEIVWVSPSLAPGGFFDAGELLARIDDSDYRANLESARAALARAQSEEARARKERDRQRRLADRSVTSQARIDDAENAAAVATALLREARARLGSAERDLARTELRAPYDGRVRSENVDLGQFASRGNPLARLYAVDYAEVRLPLPDRELRYLEVPLSYRDSDTLEDAPAVTVAGEADETAAPEEPAASAEANAAKGPAVHLHAEFAGTPHTWHGDIVRTEGEIDARSRMVTLVARVADPYGRDQRSERPPLAVGLFVSAEIEGREIEEAVRLPRTALHAPGQVLVVDAENRLHFREVEVLRREREEIIIGSGLAPGERVIVTVMPSAVEGMGVRTQESRAPLAVLPESSDGGVPQ